MKVLASNPKEYVLIFILTFLFQTTFSQNSVLNTGNWYKISTNKEGVYKISYTDLQNYGINPASIDPRNIKIYGNGGGMLPQANNVTKINDLQEIAIKVIGESDGIFNISDYILFFGESPNNWKYDYTTQSYSHEKNLYDDYTYYFMTVGSSNGKRITIQNSSTLPINYTTNKYDNLIFHETDSINFIQSGREWFGEFFDTQLIYTFNYNISNLDLSSNVKLNYAVAARSSITSQFDVVSNGNTSSLPIPTVNMTSYVYRYAELGLSSMTFLPSTSNIAITFTYNKPDTSSIGWLNYFELITRNYLTKNNSQLLFKDYANVNSGNITQFQVGNTLSSDIVWEITQHNNIVEQNTIFNSGTTEFILTTDSLREFIIFDLNNLLSPLFEGTIANQNLHGIGNPEMIIVTHPNFINEANNLANFHLTNDGIITEVVTTEEIYNEFSSGAQDITAINDFMEYLYNQPNSNLNYLLLFGDASYDYKNRIASNTNFVPCYQSENSIDPIGSYNSDDYYGLLDSTEGTWSLTEYIDISIGRLPVKTTQEASDIVNKIIFYKTNTTSFDDWRKIITFIADDEDNNIHMSQTDNIAEMVDMNNCNFNVEKIYLDEFSQVINGLQQSYPDVEKKIVNTYRRGSAVINFTGHGGVDQLTHENVLDTNSIDTLNNGNYPLFVSTTANIGRFDDPNINPLAEQFLLKSNAGNIASFAATRLVFSSPGFVLNQDFYNTVFNKTNGEYKSIGEVLKEVKNLNANSINNRNYTLLGDPAIALNFPDYVVNALHPDSLLSTTSNTITGQIEDDSGTLQNWFNGSLIVFIQGSKDTITTLANDGGIPFVFYDRRDTVFYDTIPINNGTFNFNVNLNTVQTHITGNAKISYYAFSPTTDASGCNDSIYVYDLMTSVTDFGASELQTNIFPNPASDYINVFLSSSDNYSFYLYNNIGQLVINKSFIGNSLIISISSLNNGVYFYNISKENGEKSSGKILINH